METEIKVLEKVKLKKPMLIEGLPGIGNVGRVAAGYIISELKMKKFAELYSPHFLPLVILNDESVANILKCEFYYYKGKGKNVIVLTGDTQSITPEGHYDFCEKVLDFASKLGVKEIITLGGFTTEKENQQARVVGSVNKKNLLKKYQKFGIDFGKDHPVGTIVGASGLLIGMGSVKGIDGICLMGETLGLPLITDPKSADSVLHVLMKILGLKLDLTKLENAVKGMEDKIKKTEKIHSKMLSQPGGSGGIKDEQLRYIG